jgi:hypothetical protein
MTRGFGGILVDLFLIFSRACKALRFRSKRIPDRNRHGIRLESCFGHIAVILTVGRTLLELIIGMENREGCGQKSNAVSVEHSARLEWKSDGLLRESGCSIYVVERVDCRSPVSLYASKASRELFQDFLSHFPGNARFWCVTPRDVQHPGFGRNRPRYRRSAISHRLCGRGVLSTPLKTLMFT